MNQTPIIPPKQEEPQRNPEKDRISRKDAVKIYAFCIVLLLGSLVGCLFFLRPKVSESEKRELTHFPKLTWNAFITGEFFSDVSLWYADTFPGREGLIAMNQAVRNLYGIRQSQIIQNPNTGNDPDGQTPGTSDEENDVPVEKFETVYVKGNRAFEIYQFSAASSDRYASIVNSAAEKMSGVEIYDMVVPLSYSVNLSAKEQKSIGASDVGEAIDYIYGKIDSRVKTVETLSGLIAHKDEYLYYRTDHHWTARGAYYAYEAFCQVSGQTPLPLNGWQKFEFEGFLGTLYASAGQPAQLSATPDTVEAWKPNSTNEMQVWYRETSSVPYAFTSQFPIIQKNPNYYANPASKYNCFIAGDNPLTVIRNPEPSSTNGKTIVVIKESYGNAFVPFLVDQYAEVHVIDYRYFKKAVGKTLPQYVSEVNADQVLFLNYIYATGTPARLNELEALIG